MLPSIKRGIAAILCTSLLFCTAPCTTAQENIPEETVPETVFFPADYTRTELVSSFALEFSNSMTDEPDTLLNTYIIPPRLHADTTEFQGKEYYIHTEDAASVLREQLSGWADIVYVPFMVPTDGIIDLEMPKQELEALMSDTLSPYMIEILAIAEEHSGHPREGDYLAWNYYKYSISCTPIYIVTREDHSELYVDFAYTLYFRTSASEEAEYEAAADALLDQLFGEERTTISPYKTIRTIYNWVCANVTYDHYHLEEEKLHGEAYEYRYHYTAYAALMHQTAVCQGYALLMYNLLLEMGVNCRLIAGSTSGGAHGWNIVEIDGLYYNIDSTWDAGQSTYRYFLLNPENFTNHLRYSQYDTGAFHEAYPMTAADYVYTQSGDVDGDGYTAEADALYLLRYTLLPERYPLAVADADYDMDNRITAADACWLYIRCPDMPLLRK